MRDFRKFCRPKITKHPQIGDVEIKLKCGNTAYIKAEDYLDIKNFFKINSIMGEVSSVPGVVKVLSKTLEVETTVNTETYLNNEDKFELVGIVGAKDPASDGDIIVHSNMLNEDVIFSFDDWITLSDDYDLVGLQGITTYSEDDASNGDYVILANGHTLIISPSDYSKVSDNWEQVDTISKITTNAVDLGLPSGLLWADRNVEAESEENYGAYFSWGNIAGHKSSNGSTFDDSYDFGSSNSDPYASTSGAALNGDIPVNATYDAAQANMGGDWRIPTKDEFQELYDNTDNEWTTINGINGMKFMKKSDHSVYVFFPAGGVGYRASTMSNGSYGYYWSSSRYNNERSFYLQVNSNNVKPQGNNGRYSGQAVRAVKEAS